MTEKNVQDDRKYAKENCKNAQGKKVMAFIAYQKKK